MADMCGICMENKVATECVPCGHKVACEVCAAKLGATCLVCKAMIQDVKITR